MLMKRGASFPLLVVYSVLTTFENYRAQNQLPTWIAQSTISGEASTASLQSTSHLTALALANNTNYRKTSMSHATSAALTKKNLDADLDSYYAKLAEEAAKVELPESTIGSPVLLAVKEEEEIYSELDFYEEKIREKEHDEEIENVMKSMLATVEDTTTTPVEISNGNGNGSGKRSRDEVESGWEGDETAISTDLDAMSGKRMKIAGGSNSVVDRDEVGSINTPGRGDESEAVDGTPSAVLDDGEEDEFEEEEAEEEEEDLDPNPMLSVDGKMVPFLEIDEELTGAMVIFFSSFPCVF